MIDEVMPVSESHSDTDRRAKMETERVQRTRRQERGNQWQWALDKDNEKEQQSEGMVCQHENEACEGLNYDTTNPYMRFWLLMCHVKVPSPGGRFSTVKAL